MKAVTMNRAAVVIGWLLALVMAVWWLGSTRLALDRGTDAARSAGDALYALFLIRAMTLTLLSVRMSAARGWRPAVATGLGLVAPSWPVVLLAWSASTVPLAGVVLGEVVLLTGSLALPVIGAGLRRALRNVELAVPAGTALGVALSAAVWLSQRSWMMVLS
jgi:hypothetical protein